MAMIDDCAKDLDEPTITESAPKEEVKDPLLEQGADF